MTKNQIAILEHASKNKCFATNADCQDGKDCKILTKKGYLSEVKAPSWMGDDFIYYITMPGRSALYKEKKK